MREVIHILKQLLFTNGLVRAAQLLDFLTMSAAILVRKKIKWCLIVHGKEECSLIDLFSSFDGILSWETLKKLSSLGWDISEDGMEEHGTLSQ